MISLKDFMECVEYKITDGYEYQWDCYGPRAQGISRARGISYENGASGDDQVTICAVFTVDDLNVVEIQAWDGPNKRQYRWIHPAYIEGHAAEAIRRNVDWHQSIDDQKFIDLDEAEDIMEKARAIFLGEDYDTRVIMKLDLEEEDQYLLMKMAHEADMTLNQFVEHILIKDMKKRGVEIK